jgi:hypothetical protein
MQQERSFGGLQRLAVAALSALQRFGYMLRAVFIAEHLQKAPSRAAAEARSTSHESTAPGRALRNQPASVDPVCMLRPQKLVSFFPRLKNAQIGSTLQNPFKIKIKSKNHDSNLFRFILIRLYSRRDKTYVTP